MAVARYLPLSWINRGINSKKTVKNSILNIARKRSLQNQKIKKKNSGEFCIWKQSLDRALDVLVKNDKPILVYQQLILKPSYVRFSINNRFKMLRTKIHLMVQKIAAQKRAQKCKSR